MARNLNKVIDTLEPVKAKFGNNLWIAPSCSLLHSPQDLAVEEKLDGEIKSWMAFAAQKLVELGTVKRALENGKDSVKDALAASDAAAADRATNKKNPQSRRTSARRQPESRRRPTQIALPRAHQSAAGMDETAAVAHHHHRFVPANR